MADSKGENGGLFARVFKFVRSPASNWTGLDVPEEAHESGYSKQMLKEMIERKRRNDFVRKREFDMLRKLRRSEVISGNDPAGRPSFFQSSMPSRPDDRASTLKKIDEIEAQMSQQWWKTKNVDVTSTDGLGTTSAPVPPPGSAPGASARPLGPGLAAARVSESRAAEPPPLSLEMPLFSLDSTQPAQPWPAAATAPTEAAALPQPDPQPEVPSFPSLFSESRTMAVEVEEFAHDAELEDAAIRFAHGDDEGAETALRDLLQPGGLRQDDADTWLALFDLYRATGRQDRFDEAALEFANRFGRSAPQWLSLPQLASRAAAAAPAVESRPPTRPADWTCPAALTVQSVANLQATLARASPPWRLSWARLGRIEEPALEALARLFSEWATQPVRLQFIGAERLDSLLRQHTVSGERDSSPNWWKLRMEMLRVVHQPDEFELVALDYCVTYEVSPPSWDRPRCQFQALEPDGSETQPTPLLPSGGGGGYVDSMITTLPASGFGDTASPSRLPRPITGELSGSLRGEATVQLDRLSNAIPGSVLSISCARLLRIDFAAAGGLLNWATARQAEGCILQFTEVHRLIAPFFGVVGVSATARVLVRRD